MKNLKLFFLAPVFSIIIFSCSEEEKTPDPVAQAAGTYNYQTKMYLLSGSQLIHLGADTDDSGTAIVTKTATGFEVKEGGQIVFAGSKVAVASNGFTFDIESQTFAFDGISFEIEGYDGATLNGIKYNGLYESASGQLTGYMKFDSVAIDENENEVQVTVVIEFVGTKV
jgi:hypothetical protein